MVSLQKIFNPKKINHVKINSEDFKKEDITVRYLRIIARPFVDIIEPITFLTPNRLTWIGMLFTFLAGYIIAIAGDNNLILFSAGFVGWVGLLFDVIDGEIARRRGMCTKNGAWLDSSLEQLKGVPFLVGIAFNISDANGMFTLVIGDFSLTQNVWFVLFILYACLSFISIGASRSTFIYEEQRLVSHGHAYVAWLILIFNVLELYLVLHTMAALFGVIYILAGKTFSTQYVPNPDNKT